MVGLNEIKATQPNLALAWPGLSLAKKRGEKRGVRMMKIVATNVVASRER